MYEINPIHRLHIVHLSPQLISHIPRSVTGEKLVNQFLRCIPDETWLFQHYRVPLNLVTGEWVWQVSSCGPSHAHLSPRLPLVSARIFFISFVQYFVSSSRGEASYTRYLGPSLRSQSPFQPRAGVFVRSIRSDSNRKQNVIATSSIRPCLREVVLWTVALVPGYRKGNTRPSFRVACGRTRDPATSCSNRSSDPLEFRYRFSPSTDTRIIISSLAEIR